MVCADFASTTQSLVNIGSLDSPPRGGWHPWTDSIGADRSRGKRAAKGKWRGRSTGRRRRHYPAARSQYPHEL